MGAMGSVSPMPGGVGPGQGMMVGPGGRMPGPMGPNSGGPGGVGPGMANMQQGGCCPVSKTVPDNYTKILSSSLDHHDCSLCCQVLRDTNRSTLK